MWVDEDGEAEAGARPQGLSASEYKTPMEVGQSNNFRVLSLNARSINNKFQKIRDLTQTICPSILCIQETWGKRPQVDYSIRGFQRPDFATRPGEGMNLGGGVAIWAQTAIKYETLDSPLSLRS